MINIDLHKGLHPLVFDFLLGFLPGFFFEVCVLLANPQWVKQLANLVGPDHYYTTVFIALFLAFVVGGAFVQWVRYIQGILRYGYAKAVQHLPRVRAWRIKRMYSEYSEALQEMQQQAQQGQQPPSRPQPPKGLSKLQSAEFEEARFTTALQTAWGRAARTLLKHYGVNIEPDAYWQRDGYAWSYVLGEARLGDWRGRPIVVSLHATGWSGLAAMYFGPLFGRWPFVTFCLFLVGFGLLHDYQIARRFNDPVLMWIYSFAEP